MHNQRGLSPQEVCGRVSVLHCITAQSAVVQLPEIAHLDSFTCFEYKVKCYTLLLSVI